MGIVVEINSSSQGHIPDVIAVLEMAIADAKETTSSLLDLQPHLRKTGNAALQKIQHERAVQLGNLQIKLQNAREAARLANPETTAEEQAQIMEDLVKQARAVTHVSNTINIVSSLDRDFVLEILKARISNVNERGCWLSSNKPGHRNGYQKFNLRKTTNRTTKLKIGVAAWAHQLALVAREEGELLRLTQNGAWNVSHRCHESGCFNPDHVLIEPNADNRARNDCHRSNRNVNGEEVAPCTHGKMSRRQCCIPLSPHRPFDPSGYVDMTDVDMTE